MRKRAELARLLEEIPEAYYWTGFLLADGCVKSGKRLVLNLAVRDEAHLRACADFLSFTGRIGTSPKASVYFAVSDIEVIPVWCEKFNIHRAKTYNPPESIFNYPPDLRLSLVAGFIDGDGRVAKVHKRKDAFLTIKCHASWLSILNQMSEIIYEGSGCIPIKARIDNQGYAKLHISNNTVLRQFVRRVKALRLPLLERKWANIDTTGRSKQDLAKERKAEVFALLARGVKKQDIAHQLGVGPSAISQILKRNKL